MACKNEVSRYGICTCITGTIIQLYYVDCVCVGEDAVRLAGDLRVTADGQREAVSEASRICDV